MIFERHFEDKLDEAPSIGDGMLIIEEEIKKEDLSMSSGGGCGINNQSNSETCSIDAEPFQFLDSPKAPSALKDKPKKEKPAQLQILDDGLAGGPPPTKSKSKDKSPTIAMISQ
jgi:hypothetical protein